MGFLLVLACILIYSIIFKKHPSDAPRRTAFLMASVIFGVLVTASVEILNIFQAIQFSSIVSFWILVSGILCLLAIKEKAWMDYQPHFLLKNYSRLEKCMLGVILVILLAVFVIDIKSPPNSWDALNYHMSRVFFWKQNHSVNHFPTPEFRQLFIQPWTAFAMLHFQILAGSDQWANLISGFCFIGTILGGSLIAFLLGFQRQTQVLTAFLIATIPTAIIEATTVRLDMVVAFWLTALVCFLLLMRSGKFFYIIFFGLTLGLGMLTKGTFFLFAPPFLMWFVWILWKHYPRKYFLMGLGVVGFLAVAINFGFWKRNFDLVGAPLGPKGMSQWALCADMTLPLLVFNALKIFMYQLGTGWDAWNEGVVKAIYGLHHIFGVDMMDPRSMYSQAPFALSSSVHEDGVTNFVQAMLIFFGFGILFIKRFFTVLESIKLSKLLKIPFLHSKEDMTTAGRNFLENANLAFYSLSVLIGFFILADTIKWTNHITRYCLPLFILSMCVVAALLEKLSSQKKWISWALVVVLTFTAMPYVFKNNLRRIISGSGKATIFNTSRFNQYFRNDSSYIEPYTKAVDAVWDLNCREVGIYMGFNYWDYPLQVAVERRFENNFRLEHVLINNRVPKDYPLGPFTPCAIVAVDYKEETINFDDNQIWRKRYDFGKTRIYTWDNKKERKPIRPKEYKGFL